MGKKQKRRWQVAAVAGIFAAVAFACYWPSLTGGFLLDDDIYLTGNRLVKATDGLYRIWFTTQAFDYWPITNSSFWLEWRLWGLHPLGYHVTNLLLHIASALLFWTLLRRLAIPGALLAAAIFLVHPVNVESVAWIAQRKNTLSMLFFLLSLLWYVADEDGRDNHANAVSARKTSRWYWLSLLAFVIAMLSKGSVATLPLVLLLLIWWRRGRVVRADLVRALPFLAIAIVLTLVNVWFQGHGTGQVPRYATLVERLLGAGAVVLFYLYKALLPLGLTFVYPTWTIRADDPVWWFPAAAVVALTVALFLLRRSRWGRAVLFAWVFFLLGLVPVLGITDVYFMRYALVADHYQYYAILGVIALVSGSLSEMGSRRLANPLTAVALFVSVCTPLAWLTWEQSRQYANAETLWRATIARNPASWLAYNNLGVLLMERPNGEIGEAVSLFQAAIAANPSYAEAHNNLGTAWDRLGRLNQAAAEHREAVRLGPDLVRAHTNLSVDLTGLGRRDEAVAESRTAVQLAPDLAAAHENLGAALASAGRFDEALEEFRTAIGLEPTNAAAHRAAALTLDAAGRLDEALAEYDLAARLSGGVEVNEDEFGDALRRAGRRDEAITHLRLALTRRPDYGPAHFHLGNLFQAEGQFAQAVTEYEVALRYDDSAEVHNNLGVALVRLGRRDEAIAHFREALRLQPGDIGARDNLARALANKR
jgi:tetratricopeptide (TPR) repeat protein